MSLALICPPLASQPGEASPECLLVKMGRTVPLVEPRRGPQVGKSGDPHSQNADSSPRAQGALVLGLAAKRKWHVRSATGLNRLRRWAPRGG